MSSDLQAKIMNEQGNLGRKGLFSKHHAKEMFFYTIRASADRNRRIERDVEEIEGMRKDIDLRASEYA